MEFIIKQEDAQEMLTYILNTSGNIGQGVKLVDMLRNLKPVIKDADKPKKRN